MPKIKLSTGAAARLEYFTEKQGEIVRDIRELVEIESPSDNKRALDRLGSVLAGKFEALGARSQFHKAADCGDHLQVDFAGASSAKPVLLLGHFDTVYPLGTFKGMPCRLNGGRLTGPGVLDMKSGIGL